MSRPIKLIKVFERKEGKTKVYENGFVESYVYEGAIIDLPYILEGKKQLLETGLRRFYVLTEAEGSFTITNEAKVTSASAEYSSHISAIAIVTNNLALTALIDIYNRINRPVVPTQVFTRRENAQLWLNSRM